VNRKKRVNQKKTEESDKSAVPNLQNPSVTQLVKPEVEEIEWNGYFEISGNVEEFLTYTQKKLGPRLHLIDQFRTFILFKELKADYSKPVTIHPQLDSNPKCLFSLFIQNFEQKKNSDRREAISSGRYKDPLQGENHIDILKNIVKEQIEDLRNKGVNTIIAREAAKLSSSSSDIFALTDDAHEAAGVLLVDCQKRGRRMFAYMIKSVQRIGIPIPQEKIKMIITGKYKGIELFSDKGRPLHWLPSKKNMNRMKRAHSLVVPEEFWSELW